MSGIVGGPSPAFGLGSLAKTLQRWRDRASQRRQLAGLTARELDDIGVSADAAAAEAAKPFWRA